MEMLTLLITSPGSRVTDKRQGMRSLSTFRQRWSLTSDLHPTRRVALVRESLLVLGQETRPDKSLSKMCHEEVNLTKGKLFNVMVASISTHIVKMIKRTTHSKFPRYREKYA